MEHIETERIRDFATEVLTDLSGAENNHLDECESVLEQNKKAPQNGAHPPAIESRREPEHGIG